MYYSCKLFHLPLFILFPGSCKCLYARLSSLHCQALAGYLMFFSDKLNDDDDEDDDDACCCYRYYLVYMILIVHGVGVLMPWNMFINANDVRLSALVLSAQVRHGMCLQRKISYQRIATLLTYLCMFSGVPESGGRLYVMFSH